MNGAREILNKLIGVNDRLGVAVSGGADSMCLLSLLLSCEEISNDNIVVINVEHGIRGESSVRDSEFVKAYATSKGLKFLGYSVDIPTLCAQSGRSEETEARLFRKEVFSRLLDSGEVDYILTAHHEGDKTESVLMHAFRGCGIGGLVGMSEKNGKFIRPLINTKKSEILQYVTQNCIPFVTDESNFDDKYARNFIRNKVIPLIEERYPLSSSINALSQSAKEDEEFINSCLEIDKYIAGGDGEVTVSVEAIKKPRALAVRYVLCSLKMAGLTADFERKHIENVISLGDKQSGKTVELPNGFTAVREFEKVIIAKSKKQLVYEEIEFCLGLTPFGEGVLEVSCSDNEVIKGVQKVDGDKIPDGAMIRFRQEGDVFTPYGGGTKKLKEYFIDKKIALSKRDGIPLLCDGNKVLCVIGYEISDDVKITKESKNVLLIRYTED